MTLLTGTVLPALILFNAPQNRPSPLVSGPHGFAQVGWRTVFVETIEMVPALFLILQVSATYKN